MARSIKEEDAVVRVAEFLEKNYPCKCDNNDPDCPGEYYEAEAIVEMVLNELNKN